MSQMCRLIGRLFLCLILVLIAVGQAQTVPMTTVSEVRWSDSGWGSGNDRNLLGRYSTRIFTVARFSEIQDCYLRQYDGSTPPRYSRYTTALHVDYPL
jgi:hypothetical protein